VVLKPTVFCLQSFAYFLLATDYWLLTTDY
jgi:hypothetical protein